MYPSAATQSLVLKNWLWGVWRLREAPRERGMVDEKIRDGARQAGRQDQKRLHSLTVLCHGP